MKPMELSLPITGVKAPREAESPPARAVPKEAAVKESQLRARELENRTVQLYEKNAPGLVRYALAICGHADMAQEAVQDAFLRYYTVLRTGGAIHDGRGWLYRATHNLVLDRLKEYSFRNRASLGAASHLVGDDQDPEASLMRQEVAALVPEVLSPRELECLRLRRAGLRYKEIGEALNIDSGTVGALLARGLKKIRAALRPERNKP